MDLLRIIHGGTQKPTQIMTEANLNFITVKRYLRSLVDGGLVREVDASGDRDGRTARIYEITAKGRSAVRYFNRGRDLLELVSSRAS